MSKAKQRINTVRQTMQLVIVCLTATLFACTSHSAQDSTDSASTALDSIQAVHDITAEAKEWADSVMADMTVEEMAGQLIMPALYSDDSPQTLLMLRRYASDAKIGGVVLLKGTVPAVRTIADTLRWLLRVPPFISIDAEWGLAMRLDSTPEFPRNGHIRPDADESAMFDYGYEMARECRVAGINMVLGPVLDVLPDGKRRSGIGSRSFGDDPVRVASLGVAYAKGIESGGVLSVAKHFPGHGSADADSHRRMPTVVKNRRQLEDCDLMPFREYIGNGLSALMTGHLFVPALDPEMRPVTVSRRILKEFVRDSLRFEGLIVTDAINMAGAEGCSAADAIIAGADIVLAPADTYEELSKIIREVMAGRLPMEMLRDRVRRVLFYKYMTARSGRTNVKISENDEAERIIKLLR